MSSRKRNAIAGAVLVSAMMSGCASQYDRAAQMSPEQVKLYHLQLQQSQDAAAAYSKTPEGQAEMRARFAHDAQVQADRTAAEGAETNARLSPNYRPPAQPEEQRMCSINYGSTVGLVPCP
jgi:hypothetical protein